MRPRSVSGMIRRAFLLLPSLTRRKPKRAPLTDQGLCLPIRRLSVSPMRSPVSSISTAMSARAEDKPPGRFLLASGRARNPVPAPRRVAGSRDTLNLSPLMGKPEHPAKRGKLPIDRCRAYSGAAGHYIAFNDAFVYAVKPCPCNGRVFEQPDELGSVELDRLRLVLMAGFHMSDEPLCQVCKHAARPSALRCPLHPLPVRYGVPLRSGGLCGGFPCFVLF